MRLLSFHLQHCSNGASQFRSILKGFAEFSVTALPIPFLVPPLMQCTDSKTTFPYAEILWTPHDLMVSKALTEQITIVTY